MTDAMPKGSPAILECSTCGVEIPGRLNRHGELRAAVDPSLVYVSGPIPPVTMHPAPEACAPVTVEASPAWHRRRGYYARAIGPYAPGGNPVIAGPLRATETEARRDAESPESVLWHVIGHLCG